MNISYVHARTHKLFFLGCSQLWFAKDTSNIITGTFYHYYYYYLRLLLFCHFSTPYTTGCFACFPLLFCTSRWFVFYYYLLPYQTSHIGYQKLCRKVNCSHCGKATWAGCGMHIQSALAGIKEDDRCPNWKAGTPCNDDKNKNSNAETPDKNSWFGVWK